MSRPIDTVRVEVAGLGSFENFTSFSITNDLTAPSEAAFEIGDDGTYPELGEYIAMGKTFSVMVNERLTMTGRVEINDIPTDANGGATVRFTVRTKLADALFSSARADAGKKRGASGLAKNFTLKDWILQVYASLGYTESDFVFRANVARDLITGKPTRSTREPLVDPEEIKQEQAMVQPPESIFAAVDRHLRRFGLMHWDSPDGKIVVSAPNDEQEPLYHFRAFRGPEAQQNNVLSLGHGLNYTDVPSGIVVAGHGARANEGFIAAKVIEQAIDEDLVRAGFVRPVTIMAEQVRTSSLAKAAANRELSARSRRKDTFDAQVDGLSHWDGTDLVNYAPDTVAEVMSDTVGGGFGLYYLHRVQLSRDPQSGDRAQLAVLKKGIWKLA